MRGVSVRECWRRIRARLPPRSIERDPKVISALSECATLPASSVCLPGGLALSGKSPTRQPRPQLDWSCHGDASGRDPDKNRGLHVVHNGAAPTVHSGSTGSSGRVSALTRPRREKERTDKMHNSAQPGTIGQLNLDTIPRLLEANNDRRSMAGV